MDYPTPANFALGSMGGYLTYQEMLNNLDAMRAKYPSLISERANVGNFITNGTPDNSVTPSIGGNALQWVRISDNPDSDETEPEILYDAIHHAREPASLSQLIYYMWYLLENYDSDPEIKQIIDNTELYFIPVVNPDGYLYNQKTNPNGGGMWRKNRSNSYGVDLNRNYDYYPTGDASSSIWGGLGTSTNTSSPTYAGTNAFSEIETQAMKWFIEQHNFVIALNNHTSGDLLLFPYGYDNNKLTPENNTFESISKILVSQNKYRNMIGSELYPAAGNSDDFMYGTIGTHDKIYAFTPEIGPSFWPTSNQIDGICKNMMYLNLTAAKMVHNYAQLEDENPLYIGDSTTFESSYSVERIGLTGNGNFTVSIIPLSTNINSVGNPKNYTNTLIGTKILDKIEINLNNTIKVGDDILYKIKIDGGDITTETVVTNKFGAFENMINNSANDLSEYTNQGWSTTTSTYVSGPASITESPNGNYSDNQNKIIELTQSITIDPSVQAANVQFNAKWDTENDYDYVQFQISKDNGVSWIPQCGKYTNLGSTNAEQPTGEPLYDGTQSDWVLEEVDLSDYIGETIKLRFQFVSDAHTVADGFYFDDLIINSVNSQPLDIKENYLDEFNFFPNPFENIFRIQYAALERYDLYIRNIEGKEMVRKFKKTGNLELNLSGFNSGIYFLTIISNNTKKTHKIVKK